MKICPCFATVVLTTAVSLQITAVEYGGVEFPQGAVSFADSVVAYSINGGGVSAPHNDPSKALGIPDVANDDGYVSLGAAAGGFLVLEFLDNSLTTSGNTDNDLWVFEIGGAVEPTQVFISQDGNSWIDLGPIQGSTRGVDIDDFVGSGVVLGAKYSFVKLVELDPAGAPDSSSPFAGADIDAVGAISSAAPVNRVPDCGSTLVLLGTALSAAACLRKRLGQTCAS
jgi:hypothetical protein